MSLTLEEKNDNLLRMQTFFNESIQKVCEHFSSNDIQTYLTEHQLTVMVNTNITLEDDELEFDDISTELYPVLDELLKCDAIDIVRRKIWGKTYCFIVDDEGLLKKDPILSGWCLDTPGGNLYGNLIITGVEDDEGNLTSLSNADVNKIFGSAVDFVFKYPTPEYKLIVLGV